MRLSPLLTAPAALLLSQGEAKAVLTYNIFESAGNVVVQTSGRLNLSRTIQDTVDACGTSGVIDIANAIVCTGTDQIANPYFVTGPTFLNGTTSFGGSTSVSGIFTGIVGFQPRFYIDPTYVSNTEIVSSATFNSTTLAGLGFATTGLIGTWTLDGTSETIQLILGPPTAAVPGPLPLLGAGAAFGWSRRLRKRIAAPLITPPQA